MQVKHTVAHGWYSTGIPTNKNQLKIKLLLYLLKYLRYSSIHE